MSNEIKPDIRRIIRVNDVTFKDLYDAIDIYCNNIGSKYCGPDGKSPFINISSVKSFPDLLTDIELVDNNNLVRNVVYDLCIDFTGSDRKGKSYDLFIRLRHGLNLDDIGFEPEKTYSIIGIGNVESISNFYDVKSTIKLMNEVRDNLEKILLKN